MTSTYGMNRRFETYTVTSPAGGADFTTTILDRWLRVLSVRFRLVTDATTPVRTAQLSLTDGTNTIMILTSEDTQAASLTRDYNAVGVGRDVVSSSGEIYLPFPVDGLIVGPGYVISSVVDALVAGDAITAVVYEAELL